MRCCGMAFAPVRMRTIAAIAAAVLFGLGCGHRALAQSAPRVNVIPPLAADDPSTPGSTRPTPVRARPSWPRSCRTRSATSTASVPEQHQLPLRPEQGHAGHPQHPAGDPDPRERGLERHHAHHPAADLDPSLQPAQTVPFGTGPTTFSAFLSPAKPVNGWVWGVGPVVQIPTHQQ